MSDYINNPRLEDYMLNLLSDRFKEVLGRDDKELTLYHGLLEKLKEEKSYEVLPNGEIDSNGLDMVLIQTTNVPNNGWTTIDGEAYYINGDYALFIRDENNGGNVWKSVNTIYKQKEDDGYINLSTVEQINEDYNFIGTNGSIKGERNACIIYTSKQITIFLSIFDPSQGLNGENLNLIIKVETGEILVASFSKKVSPLFYQNGLSGITIDENRRTIYIDKNIEIMDMVIMDSDKHIKTYEFNGGGTSFNRVKALSPIISHIDKIVGNDITPTDLKFGRWTNDLEYNLDVIQNRVRHKFYQTTFGVVYITLVINGVEKPSYVFGNLESFKKIYRERAGLTDAVVPKEMYDLYLKMNKFKMGTILYIDNPPIDDNDIINLAFAKTLTPVIGGGNAEELNGHSYYTLTHDYKTLAVIKPGDYETSIIGCDYNNALNDYDITKNYLRDDNEEVGIRITRDRYSINTKVWDDDRAIIHDYTYTSIAKALPGRGLADTKMLKPYKFHYVEVNSYTDGQNLLVTNATVPIYVKSISVAITLVVTVEGIFKTDQSGIIYASYEKVLDYGVTTLSCIIKTPLNIYKIVGGTITPLNLSSIMVDQIAISDNGFVAILIKDRLNIYNNSNELVKTIIGVNTVISGNHAIVYMKYGSFNIFKFETIGMTISTVGSFDNDSPDEIAIQGLVKYTGLADRLSYTPTSTTYKRYASGIVYNGVDGINKVSPDDISDTYDMADEFGDVRAYLRLDGKVRIKSSTSRTLYLATFIGQNIAPNDEYTYTPNEVGDRAY